MRIVPAAGEALGIREPTVERISEQIGGSLALLVLDNLEQIPGVAGVLASLLAACISLIVIATSRAVLRVSGERVYPVLPFTIDPGSADPFDTNPAVQLFASRARAADPSFMLDDVTAEAIAKICRQVDGLPLAIELAAGQVRVLTPQEILTRLDRRLEMLAHGPEDQPERLQSIESAIRWSYDLLSPIEQRVFRHLGVFSNGFSEDAVRQIALSDDVPALPVLSNLIHASLVIRTVQPDSESRYALLETIREFCLKELRFCGEEIAARQAHAAYALELAAREQGLDLAVRGGAHNVAGIATNDDGIVIDLSEMRAVFVDPANKTAYVQGGATSRRFGSGDLYANFAGFGEEKNELARAAFGGNYDRLVELKTKYDPGNLFHINLNIPPQSGRCAAD